MKLRRELRGFAVFVAALALGVVAPDTYAQQPTATDSSGQLAEIVVTATKRSSTLEDTPISITAIGGEEMQARGLASFNELAESIPGLAMKTSGAGQTEFDMRGLSAQGGNSAVVGFYLDDTPLSAPGNSFNGRVVIDPNLYDLNRVEVLRGPQGTLYGSSSMGGTIKIVTYAPNPAAFDVSAQTTLSNTDGGSFNYGMNAMVNLPLSSKAALRIVVSDSRDSGWIDRIVIANGDYPNPTNYVAPIGFTTRGNVAAAPVAADFKGVNDFDLTSARATLLLQPTEQLDITASFFHQQTTQDGLSQIDSNPGTNAHYQPFDVPEPFLDRVNLESLNIQYRFDAFDFTSATSQWNRTERLVQDGTEEVQWALSFPNAFPLYVNKGGWGPEDPTYELDTTQQFSEEVRLVSKGDSPFQWIAGYYYSDFDSETDLFITYLEGLTNLGGTNGFTQYQPIKIIQSSFFGELSYDLTSQLKATVGARRYSFTSTLENSVSGAFSPTGNFTVPVVTGSTERDQGVNPKFDLSYQLDKNHLLYATIAKGFRPGGGNQTVPTFATDAVNCEPSLQTVFNTTAYVPPVLTFKPDSIWSYEIGEKNKTLDNRLTINAAEYYEKWNNVQQSVPLACGFPITDNAGDAHIYGAELEVQAVLMPGLVLSANAGYNHGSFVSSSFGTSNGTLSIPSGDQLQDVPNWTSSESLAYRRAIADQLNFVGRIENNYVGTRIDVTYGINHLPSYDLTNLRLGVEEDHWMAMLYAKNLFNKLAVLNNALQYNFNTPTFNREAVAQPLTFGIDLSYRFGR